MNLLVVIVTYNAMQWVEHCFACLKSSSIKPTVLVVDNGSNDGTQEYIKNNYPEFIFRQSTENLGFGKANNVGLQYALDNGFDYVYLLNQDAWVQTDTLEKLMRISACHPEYGILSPMQMNADLYHIDKNFLKSTCSWLSTPTLLTDTYNHLVQDVYEVKYVMAAHWMITRECLLKVGGFSPSFPHYGEDNNYIDRVHYHNLKIGIVPSLRVVHDRADRADTAEKGIHLIYTTSIRWLSNPLIGLQTAMSKVMIGNLKGMKQYRSVKLLRNMFLLLTNFRNIRKKRKISMTEYCAFLRK